MSANSLRHPYVTNIRCIIITLHTMWLHSIYIHFLCINVEAYMLMYMLIEYIAIFLRFIVTMPYLFVFLCRWRLSCCHTHLSLTVWTSNHQSGICSTLSLFEASLRICDILCLQCSYQYVYQRQQLTYYTSRRTNPNSNFYTYEFKFIQFYPI